MRRPLTTANVAKLSYRLAEGEEGESEDIVGKRKKYDLDRVVHSQSETTYRRWRGLRRSGRSVVSVRSTVPREVKVEISVARVAGSFNRCSRSLFLAVVLFALPILHAPLYLRTGFMVV